MSEVATSKSGSAVAEAADLGTRQRVEDGRTHPFDGAHGRHGQPPEGAVAACKHCHTRFYPTPEQPEFCCTGCEYVHRLITGKNLDRFYSLRSGATSPVRSVVFQARDFRWLDGLMQRAEAGAAGRASAPSHSPTEEVAPATRPATVSLELDIQGISCVGCVWLIEKLWRDWPGAQSIAVNAAVGRATLRWTLGQCDVVAFARELQRFGYLIGPADRRSRTESQSLLWRMGLCAAFALNGMLFSLPAYLGMEPDFLFAGLFTGLSFLFAAASVAVGGTYFFGRSWQSLRRGVLHIDLPISLGILVGFAGSIYAWTQAADSFTYFDFVSIFTFLMLVGRWTQLVAVERNRHRLLGLQANLPDVTLIGSETAIEAEAGVRHNVATKAARALERNDRFIVPSGDVVPVSSTLLGPAGSLGLDWINGESEARTALPGQVIESGAVNLSPHELRVEALEAWEASLLARLFAAQPSSDTRNRALERVIRVYLYVVLAVAAVGSLGWFLATHDVTRVLQVAVSVLVVSCPCALGVTLPLIDELVVARLRRVGVFVQSDTLWSRLRRVRQVIFDKTGTLTLESLALRNPQALESLPDDARQALWTLVRSARHPVAACIREAMMARGFDDDTVSNAAVREVVGSGLEWHDTDGRRWRLGRPEWLTGTKQNAGDVAFGCDDRLLATFTTGEEVREDAAIAVRSLQQRGLSVSILSGDRRAKVKAMAARLGLADDAAHGEMTPADKETWVRHKDHCDSLMIGDGANDSLAFAAAYCRGTPAIERGLLEHRSDFFFLGRGLAGIARLFEAGTRRHAVLLQVLLFAIAYNVAAVAVALAGMMNPLLAAILMPASAIVSLAIAVTGVRRV